MIEIASTYAVFQWEAPESPNGVIRRYILCLTDSRDSSVVSVNITNASELTAKVTGLDPFVQYWVTVFAETIEVGEGRTNFSFTTHQDSKLCYLRFLQRVRTNALVGSLLICNYLSFVLLLFGYIHVCTYAYRRM